MSNWSRAKDAHIAEKCEGLRVSKTMAHCAYVYEQLNGRSERVDAYNEDPAACIRAAEAWRKQEKGRWYETQSAALGMVAGPNRPNARCRSWDRVLSQAFGDHALAQALLLATGWTEPVGGGGE